MTDWTTRIEPGLTQRFGVNELHTVCFEPPGWPGKGTTISLGIPECELQFALLGASGEPVVMVNRPTKNRNVKHWLGYACADARSFAAFLMLNCDTAEQAAIAAKLLPHYQRVALERMYEPASRAREGLS